MRPFSLRKLALSGVVVGAIAGAAVAAISGPATGAPPPPDAHFVLEVEGVMQDVVVSQCVGLGNKSEVVANQTTNQAGQPVTEYLPGKQSALQLVCSRPFDPAKKELVDWRQIHTLQYSERHSMSVILRNSADDELARWNFFNSWPPALEVIPSSTGAMREVVTIQADKMEFDYYYATNP